MKNLFLVLVIVTLILSILPMATYADEVTIPEETTVETGPVTDPEQETPTESPETAPTSPEEQEVITLLDRIVEAWERGEIGTVVSLAFDAALLVLCFILKKSGGKNKIEMVTALKNTKDTTVKSVNDLITAANDVVKAVEGEDGIKGIVQGFKDDVNKQIEEIKAIDKEKLEGFGEELKNAMAATKLLAEMVQTTYANSTTIPMPIKNMISQKYVEICNLMKNEDTTNG